MIAGMMEELFLVVTEYAVETYPSFE